MLWPSVMNLGDTIYLLLSNHHVDTYNNFNSNKRGPVVDDVCSQGPMHDVISF